MRFTRRTWRRVRNFIRPETLRRIRSGEAITAAEYIQRRRELEEARRSIGAVFADVDVLVTPTTPVPAPAIADLKADPEALRPAELKLLRNTRPFNVWGLPAISVPCGFTAERVAHRAADRGAALAGGFGVAVGACLRAGDGVA